MQASTEFPSDHTSEGSVPGFSGMFSGAQHIAVTGHSLVNTTNYYTTAATVPSDVNVKMVSLWDIDLQHEIHLDTSTGLVNRHRIQPTVRRMYSAKIKGQTTTVAMYQGRGAEEEWRQELAKYTSIRHPNIIQIRGAASSGSIHATLFHDDLIPLEQYMNFYRHSHLLTVYIYACCDEEYGVRKLVVVVQISTIWSQEITNYFHSNFQQRLPAWDCTFWIRRSTGQLCADLVEPITIIQLYFLWGEANTPRVSFWNAPNREGMIIEHLTLSKYHQICALHLHHFRGTTISTPIRVNLATVVLWPSTNRFEDSVGIAFSPNAKPYPSQWKATGGAPGERTEEGWMRFSTSDVFDSTLTLRCFLDFFDHESWLTQANHIFSRLQMTSNFEDCVLLHNVYFQVKILPTTEEPPTGFLFLCPERDFQIGPSSFCWPDFPAYWSLDPSGVERLSAEEATDIGFPALELTTWVGGRSWDTSVYAGIRKFHRAKGFDPESQDVARHLGHQLLYPFNETDAPFAHVNEEEEYSSSEDDEDQTDTEEEDSSIDVEDEKEDDQMDLEEQDEDQMDLSW